METISKYVYEIYKQGSFTKAAKALFVSQPSLSAAIAKHEGELGFRIFDRTTIPCSLTAEGRIYIESLEQIIEVERNMKERIQRISGADYGSIAIGGGSFSSYLILSEICSAMHKTYPKINVTVDIGNVGNPHSLLDKLDNREIDVLVSYTDHSPKYTSETLCEERLVIAMHRGMKGAENLSHLALTRDEILTGSYSKDREIEDTSVFREVEFLEFPHPSDTQHRMAKILGSYKASHYKIENARHSEIHYNLMCAGIGAVLTTTLAVAQKPDDENILFFMPKNEESYRKIYLVYHPSAKSNSLIKSFIKIAKSIKLPSLHN